MARPNTPPDAASSPSPEDRWDPVPNAARPAGPGGRGDRPVRRRREERDNGGRREIRDLRDAPVAAPAVLAAPAAPSAAYTGPKFDFSGLQDIASMDRGELESLLQGYSGGKRATLRRGQKVSARVSRVSSSLIFLDVGGKMDASLERNELTQEVKVGDVIDAFVTSSPMDGEVKLSLSLSGAAARDMLDEAVAANIPVEGKVISRADAGFEVSLGGGLKAFCPVSHIDVPGAPDLDAFVGRTLKFNILEVRGKDVVVSRRQIAEDERIAELERKLSEVEEGSILEGEVTRIAEFGAFVKLANGLEGLVHLSNLAMKRVEKVEDIVKVSDTVTVKVLALDKSRGRISLGIKQAQGEIAMPREAGEKKPRQKAEPQPGFGLLAAALSGWKPKA